MVRIAVIFLSNIANLKIIHTHSQLIPIFHQSNCAAIHVYNILYSSMYVYYSAHALSTHIMFDPHVQVHVLIMKYSVITLVCFPNCYHVLNISIILTIPTYLCGY